MGKEEKIQISVRGGQGGCKLPCSVTAGMCVKGLSERSASAFTAMTSDARQLQLALLLALLFWLDGQANGRAVGEEA